MPYNEYFTCSVCGKPGFTCTGRTVSNETCLAVAKKNGWKMGKLGWICPECQGKENYNGQV